VVAAPVKTASQVRIEQEQERKAKKQAAYQKTLQKLVDDWASLPRVVSVQPKYNGDDASVKIVVMGEWSEYQARKFGKMLYRQLTFIRQSHFDKSEARNCMIFLYDDTGKRINREWIWSN
jgi:hypothetical protein